MKGKITMKKNTYTINHDDKTITLTKAYAKIANTPGTKEFRELTRLHKSFPDYDIVMRTANITADKETHGGLSIQWMTDFIKNYKDEGATAEFEEVKKFYKSLPGYYGKVKAWFLAKYPNYQEVDFADMATSANAENDGLRIAG